MASYWEVGDLQLRLFIEQDKKDFFLSNGGFYRFFNDHMELDTSLEHSEFDQYFQQNTIMGFDHSFTLIIALKISSKPIGIIQVYDTSQRNGTFFMGVYLKNQYENEPYYLQSITKVAGFMFDELRYNEGFVTTLEDKTFLNWVLNSNFEFAGKVEKRYNLKLSQLVYRLKGGKYIWK